MTQTRTLSLIESTANVAVGYGLAVLLQHLVFPLVGVTVSMRQSLTIGLAFTAMSLVRSYLLRRLFERLAQSAVSTTLVRTACNCATVIAGNLMLAAALALFPPATPAAMTLLAGARILPLPRVVS